MKKIYLNRIYVLDTGINHTLIMVRVIKILDNCIVCKNLKDRYDGEDYIQYEVFQNNGYTK